MNARAHTHKHALARQCLPKGAQSLRYSHRARSVAVSATVLIDEHEAGKRMQAKNGCRMHAQPHLKSDAPRTLANVGTSSSSLEEPHLASAPAWWFSWYGPRPIPPSVDIGHLFSASRSYDMLDEERPVRRQALLHTSLCCLSSYAGDALPSRLRTLP